MSLAGSRRHRIVFRRPADQIDQASLALDWVLEDNTLVSGTDSLVRNTSACELLSANLRRKTCLRILFRVLWLRHSRIAPFKQFVHLVEIRHAMRC